MVEERIVEMCAPTLAGIKCGSIFRLFGNPKGLANDIKKINSQLAPFGINVTTFRVRCGTLVYVYRDDLLQRMMTSDSRSVDLLSGLDYCTSSTEGLVESLGRKTEEQGCVPHEIGLFLGYPYDDVKGFMENHGKNAKCSGCWKVYGSVNEAMRLFALYRECRRIYCMRYQNGMSIGELAVA